MMQITKALALAVVKTYKDTEWLCCIHCDTPAKYDEESNSYIFGHSEGCIVPKAKLLLNLEWGLNHDLPNTTVLAEGLGQSLK